MCASGALRVWRQRALAIVHASARACTQVALGPRARGRAHERLHALLGARAPSAELGARTHVHAPGQPSDDTADCAPTPLACLLARSPARPPARPPLSRSRHTFAPLDSAGPLRLTCT